MNIQVSVMVWTVICFLLLVLILQKLLFAPMLRMMDARTARIAAAKKRHEDNENAEKAAKAAADEAFRESTVKAKNDAERMIVQGQEEADRLLAAARTEEQNECMQNRWMRRNPRCPQRLPERQKNWRRCLSRA